MPAKRRVITGLSLALLLCCLSFMRSSPASDDKLDLKFLEWLGQMAEMEELGVDVEQLLLAKEQEAQLGEDGATNND